MKRIALLIFACLLALGQTSTSLAMGIRPVEPGADTIPRAERDALFNDLQSFHQCLGPRLNAARSGSTQYATMEMALNFAAGAANASNRTRFEAEKITFYRELNSLKAKYGC